MSISRTISKLLGVAQAEEKLSFSLHSFLQEEEAVRRGVSLSSSRQGTHIAAPTPPHVTRRSSAVSLLPPLVYVVEEKHLSQWWLLQK